MFRLDKLADDHKTELEELQKELMMMKQILDQKNCEIQDQNTVLEAWKPKIDQIPERDRDLKAAKAEVERIQASFLVRLSIF